jgi:tripartite-type tricarboxylate transporter receptor subunit TctC
MEKRMTMKLLAAALALAAGVAHGAYPEKPIRLIVPYPPGGGVDASARVLTHTLTDRIGQQIVIDNRGGSGGSIGAEIAVQAAPDGYTLLYGTTSTHAISPNLYRKLPYDPGRDFTPVALVGVTPYVLSVHPSLPVKSVKELIAYAKAHPGKLNFASAGNGSALHLAGAMLKSMAGIDIVHVPYKGGGPALNDLIGGRVQMMFAPASTMMPHVKAGRLRALGVSSAKRTKVAPELPPIADTVPGYEASGWYAVFGPRGLPRAIAEKLNKDINAVLHDPSVAGRYTALGVEPEGGSAADLARFVKSEMAKWGKAVKDSGARVD